MCATVSFDYTVTDTNGDEHDCTCEFEYEAEDKGSWLGGLQQEPDYPASMTLLSAKNKQGVDLYNTLPPEEIERLEELALNEEPDFDEPDDWDGPY